MTIVKVIRKDEDGETPRTFQNCPQYEVLKVGDVVEVEHANGQLQDYYVIETKWEFSHFGNTLVVIIEPQTYTPRPKMIHLGLGQTVWVSA